MQLSTTTPSLDTMSIAQLVAEHNRLNPEGTVKSFRDKGTALKRVAAVMTAIKMEADEEETPVAEDKPKAVKVKADKTEATERKRRGYRFVFPENAEHRAPRDGCRRRILFDLLNRPEGTTHAEVMKKVDLTERQAYEAIRLIHYAHGFGLRQDDTGRIYLKVLHPEIPADPTRKK